MWLVFREVLRSRTANPGDCCLVPWPFFHCSSCKTTPKLQCCHSDHRILVSWENKKGDEVRKTTKLPEGTKSQPNQSSTGNLNEACYLWPASTAMVYRAPWSVSLGIPCKYETTKATKGNRASILTIHHTSTPLTENQRMWKLDPISSKPRFSLSEEEVGGGSYAEGWSRKAVFSYKNMISPGLSLQYTFWL